MWDNISHGMSRVMPLYGMTHEMSRATSRKTEQCTVDNICSRRLFIVYPPLLYPACSRGRRESDGEAICARFFSRKLIFSLRDVNHAARVCTPYSSMYTRWPCVFGWKQKGRFSKPSTHPPSPVQASTVTTMTTPVTYVKQKKKQKY